jgi:hypothetical protein
MVMRRRVVKVGCCGYSARTRAFNQVAATLCKQQVMGFTADVLIKLCCARHQYAACVQAYYRDALFPGRSRGLTPLLFNGMQYSEGRRFNLPVQARHLYPYQSRCYGYTLR